MAGKKFRASRLSLRSSIILSAAAGLAVAAWLPSGVLAQAAGDAAAPADAQAGQQGAGDQTAQSGQNSAATGTLQEVVVTAEKRATDIQTTPISMEAISSNTLESQNQREIIDLQTTEPGLQVSNIGLAYTAPNIRGIGNDQFSVAETPGVATIRDGLFLQGIHDTTDPFFDMSDVEVLRGPQGDFIGFSSTGGAIELNSANPTFNGNNGYLEMEVGNYSDKRIDGALNAPVTDTFAARLAFNEETMGSFYRDIGSLVTPDSPGGNGTFPIQDPGSVDDKNMRLSLLWKPLDNFQALLKIEYNSSNPGALSGEPNQVPFTLPAKAIANGCPDAIAPGGVTPAGPGGTCYSEFYPYSTHIPFVINYGWGGDSAGQASSIYERLPALGEPFTDYRDGLHLQYTLPDGIQITSITGFQQQQWNDLSLSCACDLATSGVGYEYVPKDDYYSQEFDFLSPSSGKFTWIGGVSWFARWSGVDDTSITSTSPYSLTDPEIVASNTLTVQRMVGVFYRASYQFTPAWQLQVGVRDNWDNNYARGPIDQVEESTLSPTTHPCTEAPALLAGYGCVNLPTNSGFKDTVPTGKVTLNWSPAQGQFFYVFYARGYTPGGYVAGTSAPYLPEHVSDYEVGWKTTQLDGHLQGSLGGYWMIYQNMQQTVYDTSTGTSGTGNLGTSHLRGIETTWTVREAGFGLTVTGAFEKSSLGAITTVATYALPGSAANKGQCTGPGGTTVGPGQANCFNFNPYLVNLSGEPNPFAPEFSGGVTLDYGIALGGGTLDPKIQYNYTGTMYGSIFQIPYYELGARRLWNAYLTYDKGQWDAEAFITNFTNQVYISGDFGGSDVYYGNPMQVGVRFRKDF